MSEISGHEIEIKNRQEIKITGVKKVDAFNEKEFTLDTVLGYMSINGSGLSIGKMDLDNGLLVIKGQLNSLKYLSKEKSSKDENIWKKIFK